MVLLENANIAGWKSSYGRGILHQNVSGLIILSILDFFVHAILNEWMEASAANMKKEPTLQEGP